MRIPLLFALALAMNPSAAQAQLKLRDLASEPKPYPLRSDAECAADSLVRSPVPRDTTFQASEPLQLVLPTDGYPSSMKGKHYTVQLHLTRGGAVDSVLIVGPPFDERYRPRWVAMMKAYRFHPARYRGCRVEDWNSLSMSF
ncbi:MAG: hypothetical protein V4558_09725 [Gemmatimonadota bacterium]